MSVMTQLNDEIKNLLRRSVEFEQQLLRFMDLEPSEQSKDKDDDDKPAKGRKS